MELSPFNPFPPPPPLTPKSHTNPLFLISKHVIEETKRLGCSLQFCQFQHIRREGNRLAYGLVRRAVLSADTNV